MLILGRLTRHLGTRRMSPARTDVFALSEAIA